MANTEERRDPTAGLDGREIFSDWLEVAAYIRINAPKEVADELLRGRIWPTTTDIGR